jgi:hypothetical protein
MPKVQSIRSFFFLLSAEPTTFCQSAHSRYSIFLLTFMRKMPPSIQRLSRLVVVFQIAMVAWDSVGLMDRYGLHRTQLDGLEYLTMTHGLLRGEALRTPSTTEPQPYRWIGEWPLGYPALIALAHKLTGIAPFYVSRWLNLLLYVGSYLLLRRASPTHAEGLFLTLWPPNATWMVSFILSENAFGFLLFAFIGLFSSYFQSDKNKPVKALFGALLLLSLFLMRYIGIAIGIAVGLMSIKFLYQRRWTDGIVWGTAAFIQVGFAVGYFWWNSLNDPTGKGGLALREMPPPADFWAYLFRDARTFQYFLAVLMLFFIMRRWGNPTSSAQAIFPPEVQLFMVLSTLTQAGVYAVSLLAGRIGTPDIRHFWPILLPVEWLLWEYLLRRIPSSAYFGLCIGIVLWQARNTYQATQATTTHKFLPYAYLKALPAAYDTLPPHACVVGGSTAYAIFGQRKDLTLAGEASYWPVLLRQCTCLYIDCGLDLERFRVEGSGGTPWVFIFYCNEKCRQDTVCLGKIFCSRPKALPPK